MSWRPLLLLLAGCASSSGPAGGSDGGPGGDAASGPPALAGGRWELQQVGAGSAVVGPRAPLLFLGEERLVAWAELGAGGDADQDVVAAVEAGGSWSAATPVTTGDQENAWPSLVSDRDRVYLAWSGRPDALNDVDVYLSVRAGGTWLQAINLTSPSEGDGLRRDRRPRIALGEDGELVVVYLSAPQDESGAVSGPEDVRLVRVTAGEIGAPVTVIDGTDRPCSEAALAVDPDRDVHVVARCGGASPGLLYAHDEELRDRFAVSRLELGDAENQRSPDLHASRSGVHLVFVGDLPCGADSCGEIHYARGTRTGLFASAAVDLSRDPGAVDLQPVVTSDAFGRVLVVFGKRGPAGDVVHFTFSDDGVEFSAPEPLEPDGGGSDLPASLVVDPVTGLPSMTVVRTAAGGAAELFVADRVRGGE